jgi:hypothetical protein
MAVGPSLVYLPQLFDIRKRQDSSGFSREVSLVLLVANITRIFARLSVCLELARLTPCLCSSGLANVSKLSS